MPGLSDMTKEMRDKRFVEEFVDNGGNATQAALATGLYSSYDSANAVGSKLIRREDIKDKIREALKETAIDYKYVLQSRKEFIEEGKKQLKTGRENKSLTKVTASDVSAHLSAVEKILERLDSNNLNSNQTQLHQHLHLEGKTTSELIDRRKELSSWFDSILEE